MTKEKTVNYTEEQTAAMVAAYEQASTDTERLAVVAEYMEKYEKSKRSIVAKLCREGVYIKPEAVDKTGEPIAHKEELLAEVLKAANDMGINSHIFETASKGSKTLLRGILTLFAVIENLSILVDKEKVNNS